MRGTARKSERRVKKGVKRKGGRWELSERMREKGIISKSERRVMGTCKETEGEGKQQ